MNGLAKRYFPLKTSCLTEYAIVMVTRLEGVPNSAVEEMPIEGTDEETQELLMQKEDEKEVFLRLESL